MGVCESVNYYVKALVEIHLLLVRVCIEFHFQFLTFLRNIVINLIIIFYYNC